MEQIQVTAISMETRSRKITVPSIASSLTTIQFGGGRLQVDAEEIGQIVHNRRRL